jgi:putative hydrolase of the HAD superfamily
VKPAVVLFDAGNTLVFLDYPRLARGVGDALGLELDASALRAEAAGAALAMERRELRTDRERGAAFLLALFERVGVPASREPELRAALLAMHAERHLWTGVDPRTPAALARLRDAGIRTGVVSNGDGRASAALEAAGLLGHMEVVVDSGVVGVEKPDPRIFEIALGQMGVAADGAVYVGDLYEVDVVGARAAGMQPVLLDPDGLHAERDVPRAPDVASFVDDLLRPQP